MSNVTAPSAPETLADLLSRLGYVPPERVRFRPPPGLATEGDLLASGYKLCELVDGVLVEKAMGYYESRLALVLAALLEAYAQKQRLGIVLGADATTRLKPGLIRLPDVSFVSLGRLPEGKVPRGATADIVPDLAVEVISQGNTVQEMDRKLREYFAAGVRLVWYVYPESQTVRVFTAPDQHSELGKDRHLDGGDVVPGFSVLIRDWFAQAELRD